MELHLREADDNSDDGDTNGAMHQEGSIRNHYDYYWRTPRRSYDTILDKLLPSPGSRNPFVLYLIMSLISLLLVARLVFRSWSRNGHKLPNSENRCTLMYEHKCVLSTCT